MKPKYVLSFLGITTGILMWGLIVFTGFIADLLKLSGYFLFGYFLRQLAAMPHLRLITNVGSGIVAGMSVWIIVIVYQKGVVLQEGNALTV